MARPTRAVIGGVDTHASTHHAAVVDLRGVLRGSQEFTATAAGYSELLKWLRSHGRIDRVGVEGTGAYGVGLARHLHDKGVSVIEVPRPDRRQEKSWRTSSCWAVSRSTASPVGDWLLGNVDTVASTRFGTNSVGGPCGPPVGCVLNRR